VNKSLTVIIAACRIYHVALATVIDTFKLRWHNDIMLELFSVKNYRNLILDEPVTLKALNVFIGPNGAGKSNLFESTRFLSDSLQNGMHKAFQDRGGASSILNKNLPLPSEITFKWQFSAIEAISQGIPVEYLLEMQLLQNLSFEIKKERLQEIRPRRAGAERNWIYLDFSYGHGVVNRYDDIVPTGFEQRDLYKRENIGDEVSEQKDRVLPNELAMKEIASRTAYPALHYIRSEVSSWAFYNGNNMNVSAIQNQPSLIDPLQYYLSAGGENLAIMLYNLTSRDEEGFESILHRILTALCEDFEDLKFPLLDSNHIEMRWKSKNFRNKPLTLKELSDGTIRMLCWIAILAHPKPSSLICIDEPELGLHPAWIPILADLIKSASKRSQILVATHSPDLLDYFSDRLDDILVTESDEHGMAVFRRLDTEELSHWLEKFRLGEMYRKREPVIGGWPY